MSPFKVFRYTLCVRRYRLQELGFCVSVEFPFNFACKELVAFVFLTLTLWVPLWENLVVGHVWLLFMFIHSNHCCIHMDHHFDLAPVRPWPIVIWTYSLESLASLWISKQRVRICILCLTCSDFWCCVYTNNVSKRPFLSPGRILAWLQVLIDRVIQGITFYNVYY